MRRLSASIKPLCAFDVDCSTRARSAIIKLASMGENRVDKRGKY